MNIKQKFETARTVVESITRHHDAPETDVRAMAEALKKYIDLELKEMPDRRKQYAAMRRAEVERVERAKTEKAQA